MELTADEQRYIKELIGLMENHPDINVLPLVSSEIMYGDNFDERVGSWGDAGIYKAVRSSEGLLLKDREDDNPEAALAAVYGPEYVSPLSWEEIERAYDKLPWEGVILVYIGLPNHF